MNKQTTFILVAVVALVGIVLWALFAEDTTPKTPASLTSREVALRCTTDMATEYHIHPELTIIVLGTEVKVPQNTGIKSNCMTSIHTHDEPHVLHVEAPIQKDFTLGDFFAVWEKDFSRTQLLENTVGAENTLTVTINGVIVDTYESTILRDTDKIVIEYK